jgi:hypothetical protein
MAITIDHKLNIIIVLLVVLLGVFLGYVMIGRGEGYALECAACLKKLNTAKACTMINGYTTQTGCAEDASANQLLMDARTNSKYNPKTNLCDNYGVSCDGGAPAQPRAECTAETQTQFVYVHNPDGSVYIKDGYIYSQDAQCPDGKVVIDKQVSGNVPESLYTYKCCPQ